MQKIIEGNCLEVMKSFPDNHFTSIITDPPYGLKFMGKKWDYDIPEIKYWTEMLRIIKPGGYLLAMGGSRTFHRLGCKIEDAGFEIRDTIIWLYGSGFPKSHNNFGLEGYGTALKPAHEPILMAMKPLDGTYKQNAEKWGVAGINIEKCRIGDEKITTHSRGNTTSFCKRPTEKTCEESNRIKPQNRSEFIGNSRNGRWPANIILDEEAAQMLDQQTGILTDSGGASRFFYCAKTSSLERNKGLDSSCTHPTVKPISLMEYLIKLIMPPKDGLILDPFAGSGTTIIAAKRLGYAAIGIEKEPEYAEIAIKRLEAYEAEPEQLDILDAKSNL